MKTTMQKMIELLEAHSYYIPLEVMIEARKLLNEEEKIIEAKKSLKIERKIIDELNFYKKNSKRLK